MCGKLCMVRVVCVQMGSECVLSSCVCVFSSLGVCCLTQYACICMVNVYMYICMLPCMSSGVHACLATWSVTHLFWVRVLCVCVCIDYELAYTQGVGAKCIFQTSRYMVCASNGCACPKCMYFCKTTVCLMCVRHVRQFV